MKEDITITGERVVLGTANPRNETDHLDRYRFSAEYVEGKRVLDVACGSGYGTHLLAERGAKEVCGVDISKEAIEYAKEKYVHEAVSFHSASAAELPFQDDVFDVIVSFETIEHLPDDVRAAYLAEMQRVLAPGGVVIISTPNKEITTPWKDKPNNPYHVLEYTEAALGKELRDAGFAIAEMWGQRLVHVALTWFFVRKGIRLIEVLLRKKFAFYSEASGPGVVHFSRWYRPVFFVVVCRAQ